jgi:hypothetical protein
MARQNTFLSGCTHFEYCNDVSQHQSAECNYYITCSRYFPFSLIFGKTGYFTPKIKVSFFNKASNSAFKSFKHYFTTNMTKRSGSLTYFHGIVWSEVNILKKECILNEF